MNDEIMNEEFEEMTDEEFEEAYEKYVDMCAIVAKVLKKRRVLPNMRRLIQYD